MGIKHIGAAHLHRESPRESLSNLMETLLHDPRFAPMIKPGISVRLLQNQNTVFVLAMYHQDPWELAHDLHQWRQMDMDTATSTTFLAHYDRSRARVESLQPLVNSLVEALCKEAKGLAHATTSAPALNFFWNDVNMVDISGVWQITQIHKGCYSTVSHENLGKLLLSYGPCMGWLFLPAVGTELERGSTETFVGEMRVLEIDGMRVLPVQGERFSGEVAKHSSRDPPFVKLRTLRVSDYAKAVPDAVLVAGLAMDPMFKDRYTNMFNEFAHRHTAYVAVSDVFVAV